MIRTILLLMVLVLPACGARQRMRTIHTIEARCAEERAAATTPEQVDAIQNRCDADVDRVALKPDTTATKGWVR